MWPPSKTVLSLIIFISLILTPLALVSTSAGVVNNQSSNCADLLMLFARGSSSNPNSLNTDAPFSEDFQNGIPDPNDPTKKIGAEEIPGSFFRWMEKRIVADYPNIDYKAISVHYDPSKGYSQHGYPAVGIFNPDTVGNALQARFSWWKVGEYTDSVTSGSQELAGHIRDNAINCPNQRLVVGGYSQGAQVVHEALKITTQSERNLIDNVVLFGDPKFISSDGDAWNPLDVHAVYPWVRGTTSLKEHGLGGAQIPYVPDDMWHKTISWCHEDDFVCTGFSGLSWSVLREYEPAAAYPLIMNYNAVFGEGHTRYPVFGVPEATAEVIDNLHTHFAALEKQRGGIDPAKSPYQTNYKAGLTNSRPVDMVLALNYTDGNQDSQAQYFQKLKDITKTYKKNFINLKTGGVVYSDLAGDSANPNRSYVAGLMRPMNQLSSDMDNAFKGNVIYPTMPGGGDYPENHGMAIERGSMFAAWRPDAVKHFVIFAERPAKEQYKFNICEAATINSLPHMGQYPCLTGSKFQTSQLPVWCASIIEVLGQDVCDYHGASATTKLISRSLSDAIILARARGIAIDVVQPHTARSNQPDYSPSYVEAQFKTLADATGGLYLKYDVFDEPATRDAIWKILNYEPKVMSISQHTKGSLLNFDQNKPLPSALDRFVTLSIDTPITLYASPVSGALAYGWDVDGDGLPDVHTNAPILEHTFFEIPKTITVTAYSDYFKSNPISTRVILTTAGELEYFDYTHATLSPLELLSAERTSGQSTVTLKWDSMSNQAGFLAIREQSTGALLYTIPVGDRSYKLEYPADKLTVQFVDAGLESPPQDILVTTIYPEPEPEPEPRIDLASFVGQSNDKIVTQDEPNNTESGASNKPATPTSEPTSSAPESTTSSETQNRQIAQTTTQDPEITTVAGEQDVKTNPQDQVGGIDEVNQLFSEDDIGAQAPQEPERESSLPLLIGLGSVLVVCLVIGAIILKKKTSEDEVDEVS